MPTKEIHANSRIHEHSEINLMYLGIVIHSSFAVGDLCQNFINVNLGIQEPKIFDAVIIQACFEFQLWKTLMGPVCHSNQPLAKPLVVVPWVNPDLASPSFNGAHFSQSLWNLQHHKYVNLMKICQNKGENVHR